MKPRLRWSQRHLLAGMATILGLGVAGGLLAQTSEKSPALPAPAPPQDNVRITLQTIPPRKAMVKWGKKNLGMIPVPRPLILVRPRDSGPLDLVFRTTGYLPVHTRAYTFSDSRVAVKLTPVAEKNTLFGYRAETPPGGSAPPDGGVPPPVAATPAPPPPAPAPAQGPPLPQR